ncbi:MAG: CbiX/SirB N-terminal domain-containing protein [Oleiphilaceae bacterium]|nr:CbiX/SirB N-terminal domain-containing protein [Oleiphilaceae bacterium]
MNEYTILLAHGSSDPAWGATFEQLTAQLTDERDDVCLAFMELSSPTMDEVIQNLAEKGQKHFAVLPLFLAKGRHLKVDIPKQIDALESRLDVKIRLLPPIGESPKLAAAMLDIVNEALASH